MPREITIIESEEKVIAQAVLGVVEHVMNNGTEAVASTPGGIFMSFLKYFNFLKVLVAISTLFSGFLPFGDFFQFAGTFGDAFLLFKDYDFNVPHVLQEYRVVLLVVSLILNFYFGKQLLTRMIVKLRTA